MIHYTDKDDDDTFSFNSEENEIYKSSVEKFGFFSDSDSSIENIPKKKINKNNLKLKIKKSKNNCLYDSKNAINIDDLINTKEEKVDNEDI